MKDKAKIITLIFAILVLVLGTLIGVYLFNQRQTVDTEASGNTVMYFTDPDPVNPQRVNENFSIRVLVDTNGDLISGVDSEISFNPEFLEVVELNQGSTLLTEYPRIEFDNDTGNILIGANVGTGGAMEGDEIFVAEIIFRPLATTPGTQLTYSFTPDARNDSNVSPFLAETSGAETEDLLVSVENAVIVIEEGGPEVCLYYDNLTPPNNQVIDQNFTVDVMIDTNGAEISGVDALGLFDTTYLELVDLVTPTTGPFVSYPEASIDNDTGGFIIDGDGGTGTNVEPISGNNLLIATLTYRPLINGTTNLDFDFTLGDRNDSNASEYLGVDTGREAEDLLTCVEPMPIIIGDDTPATSPSPSPDTTPTTTPTATPTATPTNTATPTATPVNTNQPTATPTTNNTDDGDPIGGGPDTTNNQQPDMPEELPETASPRQTVGMILIAMSLIVSGLLFSVGPKQDQA